MIRDAGAALGKGRWPGRPRTVRSLVARPRLLELMSEGLERGLTLVSAGAGYGKTSLVVSWLDHLGVGAHVAWLTLGPEDNDPAVLARHLRHALSGAGLLPRQEDSEPFSVVDVVGAAASRASTRRPLAVVLDDAHVIDSPAAQAALSVLVHAVPERAGLVVLGREDLPLGWAALRGHGLVVELREDDLVFDIDEAAAVLERTFGVSTTPEEAREVVRVTEGWAAGVCLAGLAMARAHDRTSGHPAAPWPNAVRRDASAFFDEAVLSGLGEDIRRFLEDTSVLPVLLPELCDAMTGRRDSRQILRLLVSSRIFTEAMEGDEESYRYHPLLAQALRSSLERRHPGRRTLLVTTAARWLEDRGLLFEATGLVADSAEAPDLLEALIRRAGGPAVEQGHAASVVRWLRLLPAHRVASRLDLSLLLARTAGITGDLVTTRAILRTVDGRISGDGTAVAADLRLVARHLKLSVAIWEGQLDGVVGSIAAEVEALGDDDQRGVLAMMGLTRASLLAVLSAAQLLHGQFDAAQDTAAGVVVPSEMAPVTRSLVMALGVRALALAWSGEEVAARRAVDEAIPKALTLPPTAPESLFTWTAVAWVGPPDQVDTYRGNLLAASAATPIPSLRCLPALAEVRCQTRLHRPDRAREAFAVARTMVSELPEPGYLRALLAELDFAVEHQERERPELTPRELDLLRLLAAGASRREMAERTHYSIDTVKYHLKSVYRKLGADSRESALSRAQEWGLLGTVGTDPGPGLAEPGTLSRPDATARPDGTRLTTRRAPAESPQRRPPAPENGNHPG